MRILSKGVGSQFESETGYQVTEVNAAGMVLRLALKTRFSEMGWGSTPLTSANIPLVVKWYNSRLITGHYKFDSCSGNQVYF